MAPVTGARKPCENVYIASKCINVPITMGILLPLLLFFGAHGMEFRGGAVYCLVTAALLTLQSAGAIDELHCRGLGCDYSVATFMLIFASALGIALACFAIGFASRLLISRLLRVR